MSTIDDSDATEGPMKTLAKGLSVLNLLLAEPDKKFRTIDVADRLGIDRGGASRILQTLAANGYAGQVKGRKYVLGQQLAQRSGRLERMAWSVRSRARPLLERLSRATGESAHVAIGADEHLLYVDTVDTPLPLRVDRPAGTLSSLHNTALGGVLLAFTDLPLPSPQALPGGAADLVALQAKLARIADQGYALDDEEFSPGIRCVAAPLRRADGRVVAAIGISGPSVRIPSEALPRLAAAIVEAAVEFAAA